VAWILPNPRDRPGYDTTELWPQCMALLLNGMFGVLKWTTVNQATWRFIPSKSMVWINADPSPPVSNWKRIRIRILARTFCGWSSTGFSFYIMFVWFVQLQHSVFHWALQLCLSTMEVCLSYRPSLAPDIRLDRQDLTKEAAKDGGMFSRRKYWWCLYDILVTFWWFSGEFLNDPFLSTIVTSQVPQPANQLASIWIRTLRRKIKGTCEFRKCNDFISWQPRSSEWFVLRFAAGSLQLPECTVAVKPYGSFLSWYVQYL